MRAGVAGRGRAEGLEEVVAFTDVELIHSLNHVAQWNWVEFEVPDVIGFADYVSSGLEFAKRLGVRHEPGSLHLFPWSDAGKLRQLSVLGCADLVTYSSASARIAGTTDRLLSGRVFSCRLNSGPPRWTLHPHPKWHQKFRDSAISLLRTGACSAMQVEDVENYFGSVTLQTLLEFLTHCHCDRKAVEKAASMLASWQAHSGLIGLPIGPDASRLLANAFLLQMDRAIRSTGVEHRRWMDDSLILAETLARCAEAAAAAHEALSGLGLAFSNKKRRTFDHPDDAVAHIQERLIASLASLGDNPAQFLEAVEEAWEAYAGGATDFVPRQFRFLLRSLSRRGSRVAVRDLLANCELANIDARTAGDYLLTAGPLTGRELDDALNRLEDAHDEGSDGLELHLLRALGAHRLAAAEGTLFKSIAFDSTRRAPVRCWAWKAWGNTEGWAERDSIDATEAESDPMVRRASLVPLRRRASLDRDRFLRHIVTEHPEVEFMTHWVQQAA